MPKIVAVHVFFIPWSYKPFVDLKEMQDSHQQYDCTLSRLVSKQPKQWHNTGQPCFSAGHRNQLRDFWEKKLCCFLTPVSCNSISFNSCWEVLMCTLYTCIVCSRASKFCSEECRCRYRFWLEHIPVVGHSRRSKLKGWNKFCQFLLP